MGPFAALPLRQICPQPEKNIKLHQEHDQRYVWTEKNRLCDPVTSCLTTLATLTCLWWSGTTLWGSFQTSPWRHFVLSQLQQEHKRENWTLWASVQLSVRVRRWLKIAWLQMTQSSKFSEFHVDVQIQLTWLIIKWPTQMPALTEKPASGQAGAFARRRAVPTRTAARMSQDIHLTNTPRMALPPCKFRHILSTVVAKKNKLTPPLSTKREIVS